MSDYGITPQGIVTKRLDEIVDEIHDDLSEGWGVNTRLNPKSYLNVQITAFADKIAELWELGEQVYHSMYPFSAEDASLDNAVQYGGIAREDARPTFYPIHCECVDGTTITRGTTIRTSTNPTIQFLASADTTVTRSEFNKANIRVAAVQASTIYTAALNGTLYSYTSTDTDAEAGILAGLKNAIIDDNFTVSVADNLLTIEAVNLQSKNVLVLSGNLTTDSVTGIVNFASEVNGEIALPNGTINQIVTSLAGLIRVVNLVPYIAGRLRQDDIGLRQSYADKIFARSNRMLESIKSALLNNVQGIISVAGYQNDTSVVDAFGRWAHCVEMVVDGGSDYEIALQIWDKKTDGIQTFGNTEIVVPGDEGEPITIRFNRPVYVYTWYSITIMMNTSETLPPNYVEAIQAIVIDAMENIEPGKSIIPQKLIDGRIFANIPGIAYIDTKTFYSEDPNEQPDQYINGIVPITPRQGAVTDITRIEVILGA
jgi:uncharacterized phage protein gp47/JayE